MRFRHLPLLVLLSLALLAPAAPASPATAGQATTAAKKAKACKRKKGESKKRWLKRCKCKSFKAGETRKRFKKRCPGAKVPRRKASPAPPASPAPAPTTPPAASDVDTVTAALTGTQLQYFTYSNSSGASDNERYRFCAGTFEYTRNRVALSGFAYDSSGAGTWRITQATVNPDGVSGTAVLHYDLTSLQWNDVDPAPAQSGDVPMSFNGSKVDLGGRVYDATKITC
jgi:hypothetical protein